MFRNLPNFYRCINPGIKGKQIFAFLLTLFAFFYSNRELWVNEHDFYAA